MTRKSATSDVDNTDNGDDDGEGSPKAGRIQSARIRRSRDVLVTSRFTPTGEKMPEH